MGVDGGGGGGVDVGGKLVVVGLSTGPEQSSSPMVQHPIFPSLATAHIVLYPHILQTMET